MQLSQTILAINLFLGLAVALPLPDGDWTWCRDPVPPPESAHSEQSSLLQKRPTAVEYRDTVQAAPPVVIIETAPVAPPPPYARDNSVVQERATAIEYAVDAVGELPIPVSPPAKLARSPPIPPPPPPHHRRDPHLPNPGSPNTPKVTRSLLKRTTGATGGKTAALPPPPPPPRRNPAPEPIPSADGEFCHGPRLNQLEKKDDDEALIAVAIISAREAGQINVRLPFEAEESPTLPLPPPKEESPTLPLPPSAPLTNPILPGVPPPRLTKHGEEESPTLPLPPPKIDALISVAAITAARDAPGGTSPRPCDPNDNCG